MFERWKVQDFPPGEGLAAGVLGSEYDDSGWADVPVPGDVHRALLAAGWIQDPFYDQNESGAAWMEEKEFWYRIRFPGPLNALEPGERLQLVFEGADTFATVYLNGHELGRHRNMFREAVFDVSGAVQFAHPNTLAVRFDPPLKQVPPPEEWGFRPWAPDQPRVWMRKAQFGYGWDWGPRLPTIGLWRPVRLRRQRGACLRGVHFHTLHLEADRSRALVAVRVEAEQFADLAGAGLKAAITLTAPGGGAARYSLPLAGSEATAYLTVRQPDLWWTHDLGTPALYDLQVDLTAGDTVVDTHRAQVGIRTITLDQSVDVEEPGTRFFRFVLNGVPIFARGANWIPADSFVGAISEAHYAGLLSAARDAHMNMLRVWGGGLYEHDSFYALCDRLGLLVWQDFMFACAAYPEHDPDFAAEVEAEARYQVRRLRSHPCLALWCGNNENQWIHETMRWDQPDAHHVPGLLYYNVILPRAVAGLDGAVPYWPGSPYGGDDHNSQTDGDRHNWNAWHGGIDRCFGDPPGADRSPEGVSFRRYAEDQGRFISEFGLHASPVYETLRRVIPDDQRFHHSPSLDHHNKDNPKDKGDALMAGTTGLPQTLEEYIDFSMIAQAEGLKFGIEHYRRRKPHCSGTLLWQLNDCWPVLSWSVIDYYGFGKAGYFYVRRAYAPILASFRPAEDGGLELWITSDRLEDLTDFVTVRLATFGGDTLHEETLEVSIPANSSHMVARWPADEMPGGPDRYAAVRSAGGLFPANRHFFAMIKDLARTPAEPEVRIAAADEHTLHVTLTAPAYTYFVHLIVPDEDTRYSDNYFDLEPGETRTIAVSNAARPLTPDMLAVRWR